MPRPENPTPADQSAARSKEQPLYIRLYFRKHMTDLMRAFGYEELTRDEARSRLAPLIETYGTSDIEAACGEIVEATPDGLWRLTERTRQLAVSILGRPKPPSHATTSAPTAASPETSPMHHEEAGPAVAPATKAPHKRRTKKSD